MKTISVEETTRSAVLAALDVIDEATDNTSKKSESPCGDSLAFKLHKLIEQALTEHMKHRDYGPAFVRASDVEYEPEPRLQDDEFDSRLL